MRSAFRICLLLLCASLCSQAQQRFKLSSVHSSGSHEFQEADIVAASGLTPGTLVDAAAIQNAANTLSATGAFASVTFKYGPEGSGIRADFTVEDNPDFMPVRFENFVWASDEALTAELKKRLPLFSGRVTESGDMAQVVSDALSSWLRERGIGGHAEYRIHTSGTNTTPDAISYFVEGVPMRVAKATLEGATQLSDEERDSVTQPLIGTDYESGLVHDTTLNRLVAIYERRGYLKASVGAPRVSVANDNPAEPQLAVTLPVSEGVQYRISEIQIHGNRMISAEEYKANMRSRPEGFADGFLIRGDAEALRREYSKKGYISASVVPELQFDDEAKSAILHLRVTEGALFHMGTLEIVRKDRKSTDKLMQAWKLKPGDVYSGDYAARFLRENAAELGGRSVNFVQTNGAGNTVNVLIEF